MPSPLGSLESVDRQTNWPEEARDFTPRLAQDENLRRLSEAPNRVLELARVEALLNQLVVYEPTRKLMEPAGSGESRRHHPHQCEVDPHRGALGNSLVASPFAKVGGTNRLAIEDGGRGPAASPTVRPGRGAQPGMNGINEMVEGTRPGVGVNGALGSGVLGKVGPLAPGLEGVENRVNDTAEARARLPHGQ